MTHNSWMMGNAMITDVLKIGIPFIIIGGGTLVAWGETGQRIKTLEQAQVVQAEIQERQADLRVQAAQIEAQSRQAADQAKANHELLIELLQRVQ